MLAFEPTFVEVRHVESGALMQIIPGNNLRCLFADTPPSTSSSSFAGAPGSYFPPGYGGYGGGGGGRFAGGAAKTRNEIILSDSGDQILSLQWAAPGSASGGVAV